MYIFLFQLWYYTNGILREAGFAQNIIPYITLSAGAIETLSAIISVSIHSASAKQVSFWAKGCFGKKIIKKQTSIQVMSSKIHLYVMFF